MYVSCAAGNTIWDEDGGAWLDMQSGILNSPLGHDSEVLNDALEEVRATGVINTYDRVTTYHRDFLELMNTYEPRFNWKPFNSGGEAVDKAIQIAATHFGRPITVATLPRAFHGKLLSMAWAHYGPDLAWGNPLKLVEIDPMNENNPHFDALIYEPVQGWDGICWAEEDLRDLCDERGALLIADEMITGFMRCGERFMNKTADITVCGKGLSQGVPFSLVGYKDELLPQGTIATGWRSTGAGNNLAMTIALFTLRHLMSDNTIGVWVKQIESSLKDMGFTAYGALGFRAMKNHSAAKQLFEDERIIGSWHCPPQLRVGPSFVTTKQELIKLEKLIEKADKL